MTQISQWTTSVLNQGSIVEIITPNFEINVPFKERLFAIFSLISPVKEFHRRTSVGDNARIKLYGRVTKKQIEGLLLNNETGIIATSPVQIILKNGAGKEETIFCQWDNRDRRFYRFEFPEHEYGGGEFNEGIKNTKISNWTRKILYQTTKFYITCDIGFADVRIITADDRNKLIRQFTKIFGKSNIISLSQVGDVHQKRFKLKIEVNSVINKEEMENLLPRVEVNFNNRKMPAVSISIISEKNIINYSTNDWSYYTVNALWTREQGLRINSKEMFQVYPIEEKKYREGKESTITHNSKEYSLDKIIEAVRDKETETLPISKLKWILKHTKTSKTRVKRASLRYPVIVLKSGLKYYLLDGAHRLSKAIENGAKEISVKMITRSELKECEIKSISENQDLSIWTKTLMGDLERIKIDITGIPGKDLEFFKKDLKDDLNKAGYLFLFGTQTKAYLYIRIIGDINLYDFYKTLKAYKHDTYLYYPLRFTRVVDGDDRDTFVVRWHKDTGIKQLHEE